jgi:hypothetical protein
MKIVIKILLVLGLLVALQKNILYLPKYYDYASKNNKVLDVYKRKTDNAYVNYYATLTGLETGYGFYAPNIPDIVKIKFIIRSAGDSEVHDIMLKTPEAKERFNTLAGHFNNEPDVRNIVARSLARYMFHFYPQAQQITVVAYACATPAPAVYLKGISKLPPAEIASYSFNKSTISE